jgi:CCR4-NOT transcription complex subunit 2
MQGLHNIHGNFNLPNMAGSMTPRNAAMSGIASSGLQQPGGNISTGRFTSNNLPVAMSQVNNQPLPLPFSVILESYQKKYIGF